MQLANTWFAVEALFPELVRIKLINCAGTKVFVHKKAKYGGLQRYTVVDESEIVEVSRALLCIIPECTADALCNKIGDTDFARAVTLGSYTPPGALFGTTTLNMHRPTIPASPLPANEQGKKILIWGGSSAMGALSISYAKQAGYTVVSTCSPQNFNLVKSVGADYVFDHSSAGVVEDIRSLFPIHYWFDTIGLPSTMSTIVKILAPEGKPVTKANILTLLPPAMPGMPQLPEGITAQMHRFSTHAPENAEWQKWLLDRGGFLEQGIKSGVIKGVPPELIGGLEKVANGIEAVFNGVSGKKVVFDPWA